MVRAARLLELTMNFPRLERLLRLLRHVQRTNYRYEGTARMYDHAREGRTA